MWHCYGLLVAQIWQTGAVRPSERSTLHVGQIIFPRVPDVGRIWAETMLLSGLVLNLTRPYHTIPWYDHGNGTPKLVYLMLGLSTITVVLKPVLEYPQHCMFSLSP